MTTPRPRRAPTSAANKLRAKLFMNGRSQAVRLPKEFRLPGHEVLISKEGDRIVLEPLDARGWPAGYFESFGPVGDDFRRPDPLPPSPRRDRALDEL